MRVISWEIARRRDRIEAEKALSKPMLTWHSWAMKQMNKNSLKLMQLMAEHNYISRQEIGKIVGSRWAVLRKVNSLLKLRLIASFETQLAPRIVYCLTFRGYHFLRQINRLRVSRYFKPNDFRQITLAHTLACVQTQIAFENFSYIVNYKSTKVLNAGKDKLPTLQPDAEFIFKENLMSNAQLFRGAVEVELSRKSALRNRQRLLKYGSRSDLKIVVWVCGSEYIIRDLQSIVSSTELREPEMFRFVLYGEMLEKGLKTKFMLSSLVVSVFQLYDRRQKNNLNQCLQQAFTEDDETGFGSLGIAIKYKKDYLKRLREGTYYEK